MQMYLGRKAARTSAETGERGPSGVCRFMRQASAPPHEVHDCVCTDHFRIAFVKATLSPIGANSSSPPPQKKPPDKSGGFFFGWKASAFKGFWSKPAVEKLVAQLLAKPALLRP